MQTKTSQPVVAKPISIGTITLVREALAATALREAHAAQLSHALSELSYEVRACGHPAEQAVLALKHAWRGVRRPTVVGPGDWDAVYQTALTDMLSIYFHETHR